MENFFEVIPFLGFYHQNCKKFVDKDIFELQYYKYIRLTKVKIWYGSSSFIKEGNENISGKNILGIQCEYNDLITGKKRKLKCIVVF